MGIEIERKFLVRGGAWRASTDRVVMKQAYLSTDPDRTVRVRVEGALAVLTIKGRRRGDARPEFNFNIPPEDALALMALARGHAIEKVRFRVEVAGFTWEVDEFSGKNEGLVVAEVEAESESALERAVATRPDWIGADVSDDGRLYNASLAERPFCTWSEAERLEVSGNASAQR